LSSRRSKVRGNIEVTELSALLWHAAAVKGWQEAGRAGLPISWRASPSGGGLHPIEIVCIPAKIEREVLWYDAHQHALGRLAIDHPKAIKVNVDDLVATVGIRSGCTLRLIADRSKALAAYENPDSILWRDAGCLIATLCFAAEWLGFAACPIGSIRQDMVTQLGFPSDRFRSVGAVLVSK